MCGIAGYFDCYSSSNRLQKGVSESQFHRGPDQKIFMVGRTVGSRLFPLGDQ